MQIEYYSARAIYDISERHFSHEVTGWLSYQSGQLLCVGISKEQRLFVYTFLILDY